MKRCLALCLCTGLCLALLFPTAFAQAAGTQRFVLSALSGTPVPEGFLLERMDRHMLLNLTTGERAAIDGPGNRIRLLSGSPATGVNIDVGARTVLTVSNGKLAAASDEPVGPGFVDFVRGNVDTVVVEGAAFGARYNDGSMMQLARHDFAKDETEELLSAASVAIAAFADSRLFLAVHKMSEQQHVLAIYDPASRSRETWCELTGGSPFDAIKGIAYDPSGGSACFLLGEKAYACARGQAPTEIELIPGISGTGVRGAVMSPDGLYCVLGDDAVYMLDATRTDPVRPLRIGGDAMGSDMNPMFAQRYPDIPVAIVWSSSLSDESAQVVLMTGATAIDLFTVQVTNDVYRAMLKKGYAADLSGNEKLQGFAAGLRPFTAQPLYENEKLLAIPYGLSVHGLPGVNTALADELGIAVPATYRELMALVQPMAADCGQRLSGGAHGARERNERAGRHAAPDHGCLYDGLACRSAAVV